MRIVMKKQGAVVLSVGGDNSDAAIGTWFEGVVTRGYADDSTDDRIQANIAAAGRKSIIRHCTYRTLSI